MVNKDLPEQAIAERFATWVAGLEARQVPDGVRRTARNALLDFAGLCVAARGEAYVRAVRDSWTGRGEATAIGHDAALDAAGAAFINGTAAHGEDYDDTFEGTPVHTGAVILPAALAAAELEGRPGADVLRGIAVGTELMCRMALVATTGIHRAGFHPTAVIGAIGAAVAVSATLGLDAGQTASALGIAGSMASGIIEYLAEGTWTKRMHAGWAAQSGLRAALMARAGFAGPRTVIEGRHGFFFAFAADDAVRDFAVLTEGLGVRWFAADIAFKPYPCGTMAQPYIDCALALVRNGVRPDDVAEMTCEVGEGTVHRLWEPLAEKRAPSSPYSAKFSVPFCIAVAFIDGACGLGQFSETRIRDPEVLDLARRVGYVIDPANEYPRNYTGHIRAVLRDGSVREARQPHLRGGRREPLTDADLRTKFEANCAFGGWTEAQAAALADFCAGVFDAPDMAELAAFRG